MNLEYFIAKRLSSGTSYKSSASSTIIKIAIVAIAIGMVMMLISIATGLGLQREIRQKVSAFSGDIVVSNFDGNNSEETTNPVSIQQEFYPDFKAVPEVTHVQAITVKAGVIRTAATFEGVIYKGLGDDYDWSRIEQYIVEGRKPVLTGTLNNETIFSTYLANRLGFKVGDKAIIQFINKENTRFRPRSLEIVGLYESAYQEFDKVYIMGDRRHLTRINNWEKDEVGAFEVFVDDFDNLEALNNKVYENSGPTLRSISVIQSNYNIFEWIKLFDFNIILIIVIMILIAGINMIVALLVLVLERTRMIGVLKALGASNWSVRKIFIYNAMYLIGVGLFWGNLIGLGILYAQKIFGFVTLDPSTYYVSEAPVLIDFWHVLFLNIGVFTVCVIILLIPSYIITKISPIKAIRFD